MHYSKPSPARRLRSSREFARRPIHDQHSGYDRAAVIPFARGGARGLEASAVSTRLAKTAAAFAHMATEAVCDLLLAVTSMIIAEAMAGCAAYAEALYPIPPALEPSEPEPVPVPRAAPGDRGRVARPHWNVSLGASIATCWSRIRKAQERRQAIAELRALDDRALRDIGLSYGDIEYVVRRGARRE